MIFKDGKLYLVEWNDHWGASGWYFNGHQKEDLEPAFVRSIGWVIGESKSVVRLAGTTTDTFSGANATMNILKACITNAYEITGVDEN